MAIEDITQESFDKLAKIYQDNFDIIKEEVPKLYRAMNQMSGCFANTGAISKNLSTNWVPELKELETDVTKKCNDITTNFITKGKAQFLNVADSGKQLASMQIDRSLFGKKQNYANIKISGV